MKTICANSTAKGGAISVIRISGDEAVSITHRIFSPVSHKDFLHAKGYSLHYGQIHDPEGAIIDDVILIVYRAPHSYTGEDTTEIMCHGSAFIIQRIMELLIQSGCEMARPGEFTQRAFLNGKMDLSQAEAVADLIAASTAAAHRLAMSQMRGGFSRTLRELRDQLLEMTSLLELEIDFSEEDIEFADRTQLLQLSQQISRVITHLIDSFHTGNVIKNGIPVAIIGNTNVGKSTLLNQLLHDDKAIVSDIHGTTRDTIEDTISIQGITFRFIDTAGIRQSDDQIEQMGIERSWHKANDAEIILLVTDQSSFDIDLSPLQGKNIIKVYNKADIHDFQPSANDSDSICISALKGTNISQLEQMLVDRAQLASLDESDVIVTNTRHVEALQRAQTYITRVTQQLCDHQSSDLIALDLHACIDSLSEIVGDVTSDDVLHNIFSHFCIGK